MKKNNLIVKPEISVLLPVYNGEKYLSLAIESILNQTFKNFEFIIINDASTDKTEEIIKNYQKLDQRIIYIKNEKNLNIAGSLNKGIKISKAPFIARMDSDDISYKNRLEVQLKKIKENNNIAVVGSNIEIIDEFGKKISSRKYPESDEDLKKIMFLYSPFAHPTTLIKKEFLKEVGYYNNINVPAEDVDLWFRIGKKYEFASINKYLLKYRLYMNSNSNKNFKTSEIKTLKIRLNAFLKLGYEPSLLDIIFNIFQFISIWVVPPRFKIWIFNKIRSR